MHFTEIKILIWRGGIHVRNFIAWIERRNIPEQVKENINVFVVVLLLLVVPFVGSVIIIVIVSGLFFGLPGIIIGLLLFGILCYLLDRDFKNKGGTLKKWYYQKRKQWFTDE